MRPEATNALDIVAVQPSPPGPTNRSSPATFPADQRKLVIATAWRLVEKGQTVLVFRPQRNSVEPYARVIHQG
jgi:hypothetical protein